MSQSSRPLNQQTAPIAPLDIIPSDVLELLGPPPVLPTEDAKLYYAILAHFARSIRPKEDLITWMLIKDLADHRLEIARYRRFKTDLIAAARRKEIQDEISSWSRHADSCARVYKEEAARRKQLLAKSDKSAVEREKLKQEIDTKLAADIAAAEANSRAQVEGWSKASTTEADYINLFAHWIKRVEQLDILLRASEERFSATLEEIDRHLRGLGRLLREELDKIIEGELVETEAADAEPPKQPRTRRGVSREALANATSPISPAAGARRSGDGASSARSRRLVRGSG
jgi:hypothetical protein